MEELYSLITKEIFIERYTNKRTDIAFIPGNIYSDMAVLAAKLYNNDMVKYVLPSGNKSILNSSSNISGYSTECEFLFDILVSKGVKRQDIIKEDKAQFTMENAIFSRLILDDMDITIKSAILCVNSYHSKRALLYYEKAFPEVKFYVYTKSPNGITRENWRKNGYGITKVIGEVERLARQEPFINDNNLWKLFKEKRVDKNLVEEALINQRDLLDKMYR